MNKTKNTITALMVLFFSMALVCSFYALDKWDKQRSFFSPEGVNADFQNNIEYKGDKYYLNESIETVLVIGLDNYETKEYVELYNNDQQADFLMLFVFDKKNTTCTAIHINRDTITDVNILGVAGQKIGLEKKQIALSHTYGNGLQVSLRNTADSVSKLLDGIKIDHSISTTMNSVTVINDLVGGVKVKVSDDFLTVDGNLKKGEFITLSGEQALVYVRARQSLNKEENERRMFRQQQYLKKLYKKVLTEIKSDSDFIVKALVKVSDYIVSNSHITELQELGEKAASYKFLGIKTIEGEYIEGEKYMEFYPNEEKLKELIVEQFYVKASQ